MLTASEWAKRHGMSKQWACEMARDGRIAGAVRHGRTWLVPEDAPRPKPMAMGVPVSATGTRFLRKLAAMKKRWKAADDRALAVAKVRDRPNRSPRERWWLDKLDQGYVELGGRWVEQYGEVMGPGWAVYETEEEFKARCAEWRKWIADGEPDEGMPADFAAYCNRKE